MIKGKKQKGFAIASLIFSLIGGYPVLSFFSILAIVFGHIALNKIKNKPDSYSGNDIAVIGLILGYIGLIIDIVLIVMDALFISSLTGI